MMFGYGDAWMGGMHGWGWLLWLLVLGGLVWALLARRDGAGRDGPRAREPGQETPLQLLQRRLARGEIDPEDYERRRDLLQRDGSG